MSRTTGLSFEWAVSPVAGSNLTGASSSVAESTFGSPGLYDFTVTATDGDGEVKVLTREAAVYAASEGGVQSLTLALAVEYGKQGVRVNCLCPGAIETPIHASFHIPEGANPKLLRRLMPLSKFGKPEDCASVIAFLASDDANHVNGEFLRVDDAMCT